MHVHNTIQTAIQYTTIQYKPSVRVRVCARVCVALHCIALHTHTHPDTHTWLGMACSALYCIMYCGVLCIIYSIVLYRAWYTRAHTLTRTLGLYWLVVYCIAVCIVLCTCTIYSNVLYIELWCIVLCSLCVALSGLVLCRSALHCTHTHRPWHTVLYYIVLYRTVLSGPLVRVAECALTQVVTNWFCETLQIAGFVSPARLNSTFKVSNRRFRESCWAKLNLQGLKSQVSWVLLS